MLEIGHRPIIRLLCHCHSPTVFSVPTNPSFAQVDLLTPAYSCCGLCFCTFDTNYPNLFVLPLFLFKLAIISYSGGERQGGGVTRFNHCIFLICQCSYDYILI